MMHNIIYAILARNVKYQGGNKVKFIIAGFSDQTPLLLLPYTLNT